METPRTPLQQFFRILGGFVLLNLSILVVNLILGVGPNLLLRWLAVSPDVRTYLGSTFSYGLRLVAYLVIPALALQRVLGLKTRPDFFASLQNHWKDVLFGCILVTGVLSLFFIAMTRLGWLTLDGWNWQQMPLDAWLRVLWTGLWVNVCVAVGEETIFRGYLLTGLKTVLGRWWALLVMMTTFGLFHIIAYSESGLQSSTLALAILLATLFGGLFGLIYLRTQSLWLPVILHFTWNFVENDVLNLTGELDNVDLVGALTRLQEPLTTTGLSLGNIVFLESLAFAFIALGAWLWLRRNQAQCVAPDRQEQFVK